MANWHAFKALGEHFLFDVPTNSLFKIAEPVYWYLQGSSISATDQEQVTKDLQDLRDQGFLNEQPDQELQLRRDSSLKALCLHISHDCNLRCKYCFAGTGSFGGAREEMSYEVGQKALDLLLKASGKRQQLEVDFFGGEPLLNFEVVKKLVNYGYDQASQLGKELHFTLTTNGVNLKDAVRGFLNEQRVALVLSLDGRPEVNDRMRGKGSYRRALPNFLKLLEERQGLNYYLRGTYTRLNLDFVEDVKYLYELGFRELSLEPVVSPDGDYRLSENNLPTLEAEYDRLAEFYRERKQAGERLTFFHFEIDLKHGPCLPKRLTGCGAGFDYFAVTPSGQLYPCHQFVGRDQFVMGDVWNGVKAKELQDEFGAATLYKKEGCAECWARFYCSGGCHANAQLLNGSIYKPDQLGCRLQRKRLECALALKGLELEQN